MSLIETVSKDVFQIVCDLMLLPDIFVLRRCSKNLNGKINDYLVDKYNIRNKTVTIVKNFACKVYNSNDNSMKYVKCCENVASSFQCLICGYKFCKSHRDKALQYTTVLMLTNKGYKAAERGRVYDGTHGVCYECTGKNVRCNACDRDLCFNQEWCLCCRCNKFYCYAPKCIGYHNQIYMGFNTDNPGYDQDPDKEVFMNNFILECCNCRSECIKCGTLSNGKRCKFCNNMLCDNHSLLSKKRERYYDKTFFCLECAQDHL